MLGEYPGLKQEALKVFSQGYTVQRCLMLKDYCKVFTDPSKMRMLSDVYMFKQLQHCSRVVGIIEDRRETFKKSKENLN